MKKIITFILLACVLITSSAVPRSIHGTAPNSQFPTCVATPSPSTQITNGSNFFYLGWNHQIQSANRVQISSLAVPPYPPTTYTTPICGGVFQDNSDASLMYFQAYAPEYTTSSGDDTRKMRAELVPAVAVDAVPTFGNNTTYHNSYEAYIASDTNLNGIDFSVVIDQIHDADSRYAPPYVGSFGGNTYPASGVPTNSPSPFGFSMLVSGGVYTIAFQTSTSLGVPPQNTFPVIVDRATITPAFNTWITVEKIVNNNHGYDGRAIYKWGGSTVVNYLGPTGFEFVDILSPLMPAVGSFPQPSHAYQKHGAYLGMFNCNSFGATVVGSISGTALTVASGTGIANNYFITGANFDVTTGTKIVSGSGTSWVVNISQTVASETLTIGEPWCHPPPQGARDILRLRNEKQVFLNYQAIANTGISTGSATSGMAYSASLILNRGSSSTGTPVYAIGSGSVPGLSLNTSTGAYTGTPTTPGTYVVTFTMTDGDGTVDTLPITITVS